MWRGAFWLVGVDFPNRVSMAAYPGCSTGHAPSYRGAAPLCLYTASPGVPLHSASILHHPGSRSTLPLYCITRGAAPLCLYTASPGEPLHSASILHHPGSRSTLPLYCITRGAAPSAMDPSYSTVKRTDRKTGEGIGHDKG
ncbi:hypothetical protein NHX12_010712 [Muraenolepis orangiensis]|uniref:Uncharacterized protein n=1 Tax=Muraenolepis orangiensis TaxID=630683 RepID=A0A9Q0IAR0_9TELE|nr:hypothetical protein NHX12_010712 [Muraenolepis orangiensis]